MPGTQRGRQLGRILDRQVLEPRPDPRRVDDPVAEVAVADLDVRGQCRLDDVRVGVRPGNSGEDANVTALDEAEAARPARDLGDLPRVEVAPFLAVGTVQTTSPLA